MAAILGTFLAVLGGTGAAVSTAAAGASLYFKYILKEGAIVQVGFNGCPTLFVAMITGTEPPFRKLTPADAKNIKACDRYGTFVNPSPDMKPNTDVTRSTWFRNAGINFRDNADAFQSLLPFMETQPCTTDADCRVLPGVSEAACNAEPGAQTSNTGRIVWGRDTTWDVEQGVCKLNADKQPVSTCDPERQACVMYPAGFKPAAVSCTVLQDGPQATPDFTGCDAGMICADDAKRQLKTRGSTGSCIPNPGADKHIFINTIWMAQGIVRKIDEDTVTVDWMRVKCMHPYKLPGVYDYRKCRYIYDPHADYAHDIKVAMLGYANVGAELTADPTLLHKPEWGNMATREGWELTTTVAKNRVKRLFKYTIENA